jgi:hypothetical protein
VFGTQLPPSLSPLEKFIFGIFSFSLFGGEGVMKPNPLLDRYLVPIPAPYQKKRKPKERKKEMDER